LVPPVYNVQLIQQEHVTQFVIVSVSTQPQSLLHQELPLPQLTVVILVVELELNNVHNKQLPLLPHQLLPLVYLDITLINLILKDKLFVLLVLDLIPVIKLLVILLLSLLVVVQDTSCNKPHVLLVLHKPQFVILNA